LPKGQSFRYDQLCQTVTVQIASSFDQVLTPLAAALGNFDGVHQGHVQVICPALLAADRAADRVYSTVITFTPHPQEFFSGQPKALLTPRAEKVALLEAMGVEQLVLLPFNRELANLSPRSFVEEILLGQLGAKFVSVGQDFRFGQGRQGNTEDLAAIAAQCGLTLEVVGLELHGDARISSSAVRSALLAGELTLANRLLGRPYRLEGVVCQGQKLGRTIGFPTANLTLPPNKFVPRQGVYAVWVKGAALDQVQPGALNIGVRPTVDGLTEVVEVHLLAGGCDLYGQSLTVELVEFLRPERKFDGLDALKAQIGLDCDRARSILAGAAPGR
jgi:riboflavin kinase / FMN adenylyltransferase